MKGSMTSVMQIGYDRDSFPEQTVPVWLPGSKSMAARLLILDYIDGHGADFVGRRSLPDCSDTHELAMALMHMSMNPTDGHYNLGSGATSMRFFVALAASVAGFSGIVDCSPQLRRRPLAPLVDVLRKTGARIDYMGEEGFAPVYIEGRRLRGGKVKVDGSVSSQFVSALLLASSLWTRPLDLRITGKAVSGPYIEMTRRIMAEYHGCAIEGDWSAAAFFYEVAMLCPGREFLIGGITDPVRSVQGDSVACAIFKSLGVETRWVGDDVVAIKGNAEAIRRLSRMRDPLEFDFSSTPDLVPAVAVSMALSGVRFRICNVAHLRHKESDRLDALTKEMAKIGIVLEADDNSLSWTGCRRPHEENVVIDPHEDHRIAMAFAPVAAKLNQIGISDTGCVSKSFPHFFQELEKVGYTLQMQDSGDRYRNDN